MDSIHVLKIQKSAVVPIRVNCIRPIVSHVIDSPATEITYITINEYMKLIAVEIINAFSVATIDSNQVPN